MPTRPRRARSFLSTWVVAVLLGLLIWAKLRLVAGIPRTVIAEPHAHTATKAPAGAPR